MVNLKYNIFLTRACLNLIVLGFFLVGLEFEFRASCFKAGTLPLEPHS
jgi:hypothetical protein